MPIRWLALWLNSKRVRGFILTWSAGAFLYEAALFVHTLKSAKEFPPHKYKHVTEQPQQ